MTSRLRQRIDELARAFGQATSIKTWRPILETFTDAELTRMERMGLHERATTPVLEARDVAAKLVVMLKTAAARTGTSNVAGSIACLVAAAEFEAQLRS